MPNSFQRPVELVIMNVHLAAEDATQPTVPQLYNVACIKGRISLIEPVDGNQNQSWTVPTTTKGASLEIIDVKGEAILLPGLCHAHIHLDKCFLLDKCDDLVTGDFAEAMKVTAKMKANFSQDGRDLYARGRRLIVESIECGVTSMRAHVEIDNTVNMTCLNVGLQLKAEFSTVCEVQIAAFAQDPLFTDAQDTEPGRNFHLLQQAAQREGIAAVGSAPYVERTVAQAKRNIDLMFDLACRYTLHLDFHLDYNLDPSSEPLIWHVLDRLRQHVKSWTWKPGFHVCVGHATRLTLFTSQDWQRYCSIVRDDNLPITLVGLPPSDMYMMGRDTTLPPRSTLNVPQLARNYQLPVAMAVNNIENAFTPQGPVDPLALCPLGVAIFQAGTKSDSRHLMKAITVNAERAIGIPTGQYSNVLSTTRSLFPAVGDRADFVLLYGNTTLQGAVLNPAFDRITIKNARTVSRRRANKWFRLD